ncbi:hypothetical protein AAU61_17855 [Desulfocarbo indianensis]|nr:hypothetical protein AAU61_17855 [Desulfocarbo indianensis]
MRKIAMRLVFALICLALVAAPAWAGWVQVEKEGEKLLISQGRIKTVPEDPAEGWTVMDFKKGQILVVNPQDRTYAQATLQQFCQTMQQFVSQMKAMAGKKAEAEPKAVKVEVVKQGSGGKIAGFNCTKYRVLADGRLKEEVWLTTEPEFVKEFDPGLLSKMIGCAAERGEVESSPAYQQLISSGWVLRAITNDNGQPEAETDVISLKKEDISEDEFRVPQGYRQITLDEALKAE